MRKAPYLDKIVTSPHIPIPDGNEGHVSVKLFPDLSHTGIHCNFLPPVESPINNEGRLTSSWKKKGYERWRETEREVQKLKSTERIFETSGKVFLNRVLCEYEDQRQQSVQRRRKHWNDSKDALGFKNSLNLTTTLQSSGTVVKTTFDRPKRVYNKLTLFQCLLDTQEPPPSPPNRHRFGVISRDPPNLGSTWDHYSVELAHSGMFEATTGEFSSCNPHDPQFPGQDGSLLMNEQLESPQS